MRGLLWLLVLSALAVALSLAMRGYGGYALFVLHPWRAEISLNLLAVLHRCPRRPLSAQRVWLP
jgi:HemY protein